MRKMVRNVVDQDAFRLERSSRIAPAPFLVHQILRSQYPPDVDPRIHDQYISTFSNYPGYRQTMLYRPVTADPVDGMRSLYILHEFEGGETPDLARIYTDWKNARLADIDHIDLQLCSFQLLSTEGYGAQCRIPERL